MSIFEQANDSVFSTVSLDIFCDLNFVSSKADSSARKQLKYESEGCCMSDKVSPGSKRESDTLVSFCFLSKLKVFLHYGPFMNFVDIPRL